MGCLNSEGKFPHWFGNIHLSGPCNRSCYFCIGQHMMALDRFNNLDTWPLLNLDQFADECRGRQITEVNVTGTNTDPLLYKHTSELANHLRERIPGLVLGIRTNGAAFNTSWGWERWSVYDKASITVCSLNPKIYRKMMGSGNPPSVADMAKTKKDVKVNIVLGPENVGGDTSDFINTIYSCKHAGIYEFNLREPYGQPHVGNPLKNWKPDGHHLGMPWYFLDGGGTRAKVTYWDVHYCEVESVNLYANGRVSIDYPITRGHDPSGKVLDQSKFPGGRIQEQWLNSDAHSSK